MTINDPRETRAMFGSVTIEPVELTYRIGGAPTLGQELIVSGP